MSTLEKVQLLEERIKRAITLIEKLKSENDTLKDEVELLTMHNEELKGYSSDYNKNNRLIEEGITNALSQLDRLEEQSHSEEQEQEEEPLSFEAPEQEAQEEDEEQDFGSYTAPDQEEDVDKPLY